MNPGRAATSGGRVRITDPALTKDPTRNTMDAEAADRTDAGVKAGRAVRTAIVHTEVAGMGAVRMGDAAADCTAGPAAATRARAASASGR